LVVEASVGNQVLAAEERVIQALLGSVGHELQVIVAVRAVVRDDEAGATVSLVPN
jgi:hypothetical protein